LVTACGAVAFIASSDTFAIVASFDVVAAVSSVACAQYNALDATISTSLLPL
jgi:formylmethanofuran:tetrahydromethanopterin formyltransferase